MTFLSLHLVFLLLSLGLYVLACYLTAYLNDSRNFYEEGIMCLFIGWMAIVYNSLLFVAWLANIPFFIAFFRFCFKKPMLITAVYLVIALGLGLFAFTAKRMLLNEAGSEVEVKPGMAIYFWLASFGVLLLGTLIVK